MRHSALLDENFPARLEAVFPDRNAAEAAAAELCQRFGVDGSQISFVTAEHKAAYPLRNRFALKARGRALQRRQLKFTMISFGVLLVGFGLLHVLRTSGLLSVHSVTFALAALIVVAIALTVVGIPYWDPAKLKAHSLQCKGDEVLLLIDVHDVSLQYELRQALMDHGARTEIVNIAGMS